MKIIIKRIVAVVVFWSIIIFMADYAGRLVRPNEKDFDCWEDYYAEDKDTISVLVIGSSAIYRFWIPTQAYEEQGFTSAMIASAGQRMEAVPFIMEEAVHSQDVDLIIVESRNAIVQSSFAYGATFPEDEMIYRLSMVTIGLKNPLIRYKLIDTVLEEDENNKKLEWFIPILKYHDNFTDFESDVLVKRLMGAHNEYKFARQSKAVKILEPKVYPIHDDIVITDEVKSQLDDIVAKADELGKDLLFVATPYVATENRYSLQDDLNHYMEEKNYPYLNMNNYIDEMELDYSRDFYNGFHTNIVGAQKVTSYLAKYLKENYNFDTVKLTDEQKAGWDAAAVTWNEYANNLVEKCIKEADKKNAKKAEQ